MVVEEIEIPEGVEVKIEGGRVEVSGPKGKVVRNLSLRDLEVRREGNKVRIYSRSDKRKVKAMAGTVKAHLRNAFKGVTQGFVYKLKIVYSHFPITVKVEGDRVTIHNLLGEKVPRVARIVGGAEVEVVGDEILVRGVDKEEVGQTALNIEQASRPKGKDPRVFQDGCYLFERG
ncbi:MAG: 50S ribosomal protein L6 [Hadesarchaea archaeon]|jgi:large subunit ribosomal protein L6|nr:MAG: 50S ribosomal protein L6 [Hadesarchaea archaeon]